MRLFHPPACPRLHLPSPRRPFLFFFHAGNTPSQPPPSPSCDRYLYAFFALHVCRRFLFLSLSAASASSPASAARLPPPPTRRGVTHRLHIHTPLFTIYSFGLPLACTPLCIGTLRTRLSSSPAYHCIPTGRGRPPASAAAAPLFIFPCIRPSASSLVSPCTDAAIACGRLGVALHVASSRPSSPSLPRPASIHATPLSDSAHFCASCI